MTRDNGRNSKKDSKIIGVLFVVGMIVGALYMGGCNTIGGFGKDLAEISDRIRHGFQEGFDAPYDREEYESSYYRRSGRY